MAFAIFDCSDTAKMPGQLFFCEHSVRLYLDVESMDMLFYGGP